MCPAAGDSAVPAEGVQQNTRFDFAPFGGVPPPTTSSPGWSLPYQSICTQPAAGTDDQQGALRRLGIGSRAIVIAAGSCVYL
jgi:hypothetical protein